MSEPEITAEAGLSATAPPEIPDKLYFRIGDVAKLAGIKPYVLRFWESEFRTLDPKKSGTGHRLYRRKDVEQVLEIKRLLYEKRFTIEGARKFLEGQPKGSGPVSVPPRASKSKAGKSTRSQPDLFDSSGLDDVRAELREILKLLA